jgi:hypothetical protein
LGYGDGLESSRGRSGGRFLLSAGRCDRIEGKETSDENEAGWDKKATVFEMRVRHG